MDKSKLLLVACKRVFKHSVVLIDLASSRTSCLRDIETAKQSRFLRHFQ